jgi:hypothetical protein
MTILSTPTKLSSPASALPIESGVMALEQGAVFLNIHPVTLRRRAKVLLAFPRLLLGDDLAGILGLTTSWVRSHSQKILSFQRLGACSSRFVKTGAKQ